MIRASCCSIFDRLSLQFVQEQRSKTDQVRQHRIIFHIQQTYSLCDNTKMNEAHQ
jgi:hypothetical protein